MLSAVKGNRTRTTNHFYSETMAMDLSMRLATELIIEILSYLEQRDLKAVRLVSRRYESLASPPLFTKAYIAARRGVMDVFKQVTSHPVLSTYIREVIYDASWFEPSVAASFENFSKTNIMQYCDRGKSGVERGYYETYVKLFDEQERILSDELPAALKTAFKVSRNIRRVTFADFSRDSYILGDRAEDFGAVFHSRCDSDSWISRMTDAADQQRLPRKFGAFKLLMKALSESASLESVQYFAVGDGASSSECCASSGIPHMFFSSKCEEIPRGLFAGLRHLRKLDLSFIVMRTTASEDEEVEVDALKELLNMAECLEELRLILPGCYPSSRTPHKLSLALICGSKTWKNLRTLELRQFGFKSSELFDFLRRHRHCLQKIDIDDSILFDNEYWLSFCESLHIEYPSLCIAPYAWKWPSPTSWRFMILGTTNALEDEGVPIDWARLRRVIASDDFDVDVDWIFGDQSGSYSDNESFTDHESTTSEELEFSAGSDDDSDLDSLLGLRTKED
ncbi:ssDNA endonuclease and repair protein rad10 [Lobaria immixta]|nr:ssDNA endonuclease and repair protein rad10 [Lobaria immixta]